MNLLNLSDHTYPCSLWQVRQQYPSVSFPAAPTAEDLEPFGFVPVEPTSPPEESREQRAQEGAPLEVGGTWRQSWSLRPATPEELAAWDAAHAPAPDWTTFKAVALNSTTLNQLLATAYQTCPVAAGALAPALLRAERNGAGDFAAAWATICASVPVPAEVIQGFIQVAQSCNLPAGFVSALGGQLTPPPATELGQEWSAPDGQLWRVVQARDAETGQFVGDDPGTVEKESLMWVEVTE